MNKCVKTKNAWLNYLTVLFNLLKLDRINKFIRKRTLQKVYSEICGHALSFVLA